MKLRAFFSLVCLAVLTSYASSAETVRVTGERVDVQRDASPNGQSLGAVRRGTVLEVLGRSDGWVKVALPIGNGAFYAGFIPAVFCEAAAAAPPSPGPVLSSGDQTTAGTSAAASAPLPNPAESTAKPSALAAGATPTRQTGVAPKKVLILQVADGRERHGAVAGGSGLALATAIREALTKRGIVPLISEHSSMVDGLKEARELGYDNILRATITEWEDNSTAWSGNPDSAAVSLELFDLTPAPIGSAVHRKKGSSWNMSTKSPDRFIPELVQATVAKLLP